VDIHNTNEDLVFNMVQVIFDEIQASGNPENYCLCYQCRVDTICFTLNRIEPNYIVSNRGFSRSELSGVKRQQTEADITTLIYKGLRLVNHNQRATAPHDGSQGNLFRMNQPMFDIPTISGRIFNGATFEPITNIDVLLYCEGELVAMRNSNWQNPYTMVPATPGVFSFWPAQVSAPTPEVVKEFKFTIKINSPDYEPLNHFFPLQAISKFHNP